jgi:hypothetical protein
MSKEESIVGDVVNVTSKNFGHKDNSKVWFMVEKTDDYLVLEADDSHLIKLSPPRGKHRITIPFKYWGDFEINKIIKQR